MSDFARLRREVEALRAQQVVPATQRQRLAAIREALPSATTVEEVAGYLSELIETRLNPAASLVTGTTVVETFDTTDGSPIGPDQTWSVFSYPGGASPSPVVEDNHIAIDPGSAGFDTDRRIWAKCLTPVGTSNMRVSIERAVTSRSEVTLAEQWVLARITPPPDSTNFPPPDDYWADSLSNGAWAMYVAYNSAGSATLNASLELWFYSPDADDVFEYTVNDDIDISVLGDLSTDLAPGDTSAIEVTGTGASTVVRCYIRDTLVYELSGSDLTDFLADPAAFRGGTPGSDPAVNASWLPTNDLGGFSLWARRANSTWNDPAGLEIQLDNFIAQPL